jgi:hypothetical protein
MLLVSFEYKLVAKLDELDSSCLLATYYYVSILSHFNSCRYVFELENPLNWLQTL